MNKTKLKEIINKTLLKGKFSDKKINNMNKEEINQEAEKILSKVD